MTQKLITMLDIIVSLGALAGQTTEQTMKKVFPEKTVIEFGCDPSSDDSVVGFSHIWNAETSTIDVISKEGEIVAKYIP